MLRPKRRKLKENLVELAINILEDEIDPIYGRKRYLKKLHVHKNKDNTYFKMMVRIIEYLEELRGEYKNPIKELLKDYFTSIYERFQSFRRIPTLHQLGPSVTNKITFEEYIYEIEIGSGEQYWAKEEPVLHEVIHVPIDPDFSQLSISEV